MDGFQCNGINIHHVIAEKVFKVSGQRWRSWSEQLTYNGSGILFNSVASRLTL